MKTFSILRTQKHDPCSNKEQKKERERILCIKMEAHAHHMISSGNFDIAVDTDGFAAMDPSNELLFLMLFLIIFINMGV